MRAYYLLLTREQRGEPWSIQFGDYDRGTVQAELEDVTERHREPRIHRYNTRVIKVDGATRKACDAAVAALNVGGEQ